MVDEYEIDDWIFREENDQINMKAMKLDEFLIPKRFVIKIGVRF